MVNIRKVIGNLEGIKSYLIEQLTALYTYQVPKDQLFTEELCWEMHNISAELNREIAVYLNRYGRVTHVMVGDQKTVPLAGEIPDKKPKLSGLRCLHTHPNGSADLSAADISALELLRLDAMVALAQEAKSIRFVWAHLLPDIHEMTQVQKYPAADIKQVDHKYIMSTIEAVDHQLSRRPAEEIADQQEKAILVGVITNKGDSADANLSELALLSLTAGVAVVGKFVQKKQQADSRFYVGLGKAKEIALAAQCLGAQVVITDDELSPSQIRNLEALWGRKVIDRTSLILDIFAQRARTKEGKLQVELAQMKYLLPRLTGQGFALSRQGGGIGSRGPGESKLEMDRRRIRQRINELENELSKIQQHRAVQRTQRQKNAVPVVAMVGYTNAGKTSLLSGLLQKTRQDLDPQEITPGENQLFATLDPTTRRIKLANSQDILLSDTVGFIQKLPHQLIKAFRATLEEVIAADLLLHVVDVSHPQVLEQIATVEEVLTQLDAAQKNTLVVLNKADLIQDPAIIPGLGLNKDSIAISALTGTGLVDLLARLEQILFADIVHVELLVPYDQGWMVNFIHAHCEIVRQQYTEQGIEFMVAAKQAVANQLAEYQQKFC